MLVLQLRQATLLDSHFDPETFKDSERIVAYVIGVHVGNYRRVDIELIAQVLRENLSGPFHRPEAAVDQHSGAIRREKQAIAAAAASQAPEM
jgi:hypothetical protein